MPLARCTRLERLILSGTGVTDISVLEHCPGLEFLDLTGCIGVTDIRPLASCTRLQTLYLDGCIAVTNISALANCPGLRVLYLDGTGVSATNIEELQRARPGLRIHR